MSTTVNYKGNTIATLSNETKTLNTAGTWVEGNITVEDVMSGVDLPVFTITLDSSHTPISATCNKTFAECLEILAYEDTVPTNVVAALVKTNSDSLLMPLMFMKEIYTDNAEDEGLLYTVPNWGEDSSMNTYINAAIDIKYWNDGTIQLVSPSDLKSWPPNLQAKTNISPTTSSQTITADSGYDGLSSVQINAMPIGTASTPATTITANPSISINSSGLVTATASASQDITPSVSAGYVSSGKKGTITVSGSKTQQLTTQAAKTVTPTESEQTAVAANVYTTGIVKVGAISSTYVGSGIAQNDSDDLTVSGATVTTPAGYYAESASKSVASGTAGTPSANKGTVSNHSISVTPSVTNITGYITGGTKTGTAVTVTAAELASGNKEITENGTNIDVVGYSTVGVSVKSKKYIAKIVVTGSAATGRSATYDNVTYYKTDDTFTYNDGDTVTLRAVDTYGGAGYIKIDGVIVTSGQPPVSYSYTLPDHDIIIETISSSGTVSVTNASSLNLQAKTGISPTTSSQTITADSGYDGLSSVQINAMPSGTAGTPSATKGTVSNHSVSVTPSVTNSTGYITGGTKTGTAVTVSASELVSGNKEITANGTGIDVADYSTVSVAVPGANLQSKTGINPTTSSQTIQADSGYDGLSSVQINAMPTMTLPTSASSSSSGTSKATISRSTSNQYINIPTGYNGTASYYLISATPNGTVTAPSSISGTSATVSTGTNTLTLTKTVSVTPNVTTAGYISSGTAGNSSVSLTASVTTKGATTYNTSTTDQTIASGTYLTGTQTIKAVTVSGLDASKILSGTTVMVGDANDADRIASVTGTVTFSTIYSGSSAPSSSTGVNGDIYIQS